MTFAEFLEKCHEKGGWQLVEWQGRTLVRRHGDFHDCPLRVIFGSGDYSDRAMAHGLRAGRVMDAADDHRASDNEYREALLGLVPS